MFERFTQPARDAVIRAQYEAQELGQSPIGTQHVLLAMLTDPESPVATILREQNVGEDLVRSEIIRRTGTTTPVDPGPLTDVDAEDAAALKAIGIDLHAVRKAIEENFGPGSLRLPRDSTPQRRGPFQRFFGAKHTPFSPRAKKVLELSLREALRLKHNFIAPEHIVLGMLREGGGLAMLILGEAGVDFERLRADLTRLLGAKAA